MPTVQAAVVFVIAVVRLMRTRLAVAESSDDAAPTAMSTVVEGLVPSFESPSPVSCSARVETRAGAICCQVVPVSAYKVPPFVFVAK